MFSATVLTDLNMHAEPMVEPRTYSTLTRPLQITQTKYLHTT